jgi:hypothetical protein
VIAGRLVSEPICCARGGMANRIKEQPLDLFADRTAAATMPAKQLRSWLASLAHVLVEVLRRIGLRHTQFQDATCGTIRLRLLELGAGSRSRCGGLAIASACQYRTEFALAPSAPRELDRATARPHRCLGRAPAPAGRPLAPAALMRAPVATPPALATC